MAKRPKKLLDQVRDAIRLKHYAYGTEQTYVDWIKRYILFHGKRHPREMSSTEIETFLTHLAVEENVAASTSASPAIRSAIVLPATCWRTAMTSAACRNYSDIRT
jgi:hypothetical protein